MDFEKPQDYVDALKQLEGFPLMGMEVRDGHLFFNSLSSHVALPLRRVRGWGYRVVRYGLNTLDVLVDHVNYNDHFRQVLLFDEKSDVIAQVELKNLTRKEWLLGELYGKRLHSSMNVNQYKQYVRLTDGGLCLHLDDDYDAVTNGALRVRIHPERVPFTVGDAFVDRGGADLILCVCAQESEEDGNADKPVVAFKIDRDILDRKELSFNVI